MIKVRGRYNGTNIVLLEPISLPPDTEVEIIIPDIGADSQEQLFWKTLISQGLIREIHSVIEDEDLFEPITISGKPLSETIIEERR